MLDKLKNIFVVDDEADKKTPATKTNTPKAQKTTPKATPTTPTKSAAPSNDPAVDMSKPTKASGKPEAKFVNVLMRSLEENNLKGFDYLEFKKSLQSLSNMDMDEATRFKSAMAMAQTMGSSSENLIETAKHYAKVLEKEKAKFGQTLASQKEKQIVNREQGIKTKEQEIVQLEQKIEQYKAEIEKRKKALEAEKGGIDAAMGKITSAKDGFLLAYSKVYDQIISDIGKMEQHLK